MLSYKDLKILNKLFETPLTNKEIIKKFILCKTQCKTLYEARKIAEEDADIAWLVQWIDSLNCCCSSYCAREQ